MEDYCMRFLEKAKVVSAQEMIDFVNIELDGDQPFYLDPSIIAGKKDEFALRAQRALEDFFRVINGLYEAGKRNEARGLLLFSGENNAIHFGQTKKGFKSKGKGCSPGMLADLFDEIHEKGIVAKSLLLEPYHSYLFIEGFAEDRMSDLISNIILDVLCDFTKEQCDFLNIDTVCFESYRNYWDAVNHRWWTKDVWLPVDQSGEPIILVPKNFITNRFKLNTGTLIFHYILPNEIERLGDEAPSNKKELLKDMMEDKSSKKHLATEYCLDHPEVYSDFCRRSGHRIQGTHPGELTDNEIEAIICSLEFDDRQA